MCRKPDKFAYCAVNFSRRGARRAGAAGGGAHMARFGGLTVPDALLRGEYAQGLLRGYFRRDDVGYVYSGAMFDTYPADRAPGASAPTGTADEITDTDLVAVSMLGIRVTGYEALIIRQDQREQI